MLAEKKHIVHILGCGLVPKVAEDLDIGRDAGDLSASDPSAHKNVGRIAKRTTARPRLNAPTELVESNGVEVELTPAVIAHDEPDAQLQVTALPELAEAPGLYARTLRNSACNALSAATCSALSSSRILRCEGIPAQEHAGSAAR